MQKGRLDMGALHELFERSSGAIFGIDEDRKIRFWNKGCESLLGISRQQAIGESCNKLICSRDLQGNRICNRNKCPIDTFANTKAFNSQFSLVLDDSDHKPMEVTIGSYYINKPWQKNNDDIQVFHNIEPVARSSTSSS